MELRAIKQDEYGQAKRVWELCFQGDTGKFCDYYFTRRTAWNNVLAAFNASGVMMGALHILPYYADFFGRKKKCALIAGVGTITPYRHNGVAAGLMEFAEKRMIADGIGASVLQPFNFGFYRKFGYSVFVRRRECEWEGKLGANSAELSACKIEPGRMLEIYRAFMSEQNGFAIRTESQCRLLLEEYRMCGGVAACYKSAYALGERLESGAVNIAELAGRKDDVQALINTLSAGCTRINAPWPLSRNGLEGAREASEPFNMIKILSGETFFHNIPVRSLDELAGESLYTFEKY